MLAEWRLHILHVRYCVSVGLRIPSAGPTGDLRRQMLRDGDLAEVESLSGVLRVTTPFAAALRPADEAVLQEADPFAVFAFETAAAAHGLTLELPERLTAWRPRTPPDRVPLGTVPEDWLDLTGRSRKHVARTWPEKLGARPVVGLSPGSAHVADGVCTVHLAGLPVWMTDPERTVLDAIRYPDRFGGIRRVFDLLRAAEDRIDPTVLAGYVERARIKVLRQRVGFLLEQVGMSAPRLDGWAAAATRGGSAKLLAGEPFSPTYSPRWQLSVNVPLEDLPDPAAVKTERAA